MHCELSVEIPAPVEKVWAVAQNPELRPKWDTRIARYEPDGPLGPGARIKITFRMGLVRPVAEVNMLRFAPPRQSAVQVKSSSSPLVAHGAGSWTFTALDGSSTRFTTRFTLQEDGLPWWMPKRSYMKLVEWDTRRALANLRKLVMQIEGRLSG